MDTERTVAQTDALIRDLCCTNLQMPPRERARLSVTLQCWLGVPPRLPALPVSGRSHIGASNDATASVRTDVTNQQQTKEDKQSVDGPCDSTLTLGRRIAARMTDFGAWLWSYLSPAAVTGRGAAGSLARLGELERQLALAALVDASSHDIGRHRHGLYDNMIPRVEMIPHSAGSHCTDLGADVTHERIDRGGIRPSSSESDLHGRLNSRRALPPTAPTLPGSQSRAHQRRLECLHTALRGLLAVYDCAAPQLIDLANEISDEAEMWDSLLYR